MDWSLWSIRKNYNPNGEIKIKTSVLKSDLRDYSDAYIVVKGTITVVKKNIYCWSFWSTQ